MALTDLLRDNAANTTIQGAAVSSYNPVNMVTNGRAYLDTLANKYLVKPKTAQGIGGIVFDSEIETTVTLQSEVTDHYTEQNQFFNDHVAHKPIRITLRGLVGELVSTQPAGVLGAITHAQSALTTLQGTLGKYTPGMVTTMQKALTSATSVVNKIDNAVMRAQNLVGLIAGATPGPTKQHQRFMQLYAMWLTSQVVTVVTPYKYFDKMVIEQISFMQNEDTTLFSDISVTLKEVRFATIQNASIDGLSANDALQSKAGRVALQSQAPTQVSTAGIPVDQSVAMGAFT